MPANARMIFGITLSIASFDNPIIEALEDWALGKLEVIFPIEVEQVPDTAKSIDQRFLLDTDFTLETSKLNQTLHNNGYTSINLRENMIKTVMLFTLILLVAFIGALLNRILIRFKAM